MSDAGQVCGRNGCKSEVVRLAGVAPAHPDRWVRSRPAGGWWASTLSPMGPVESGGPAAWRCPGCTATFRAVHGGRFAWVEPVPPGDPKTSV
jgi:hypothetical protein